MSPAVKYTLGRLGLFVIVFVLLTPVPVAFLVKAMIAVLVSAVLSYFLLANWRNAMAEQLGSVAEKRQAEKARLRAALAGDETAAAAGDRAASPTAALGDRGAGVTGSSDPAPVAALDDSAPSTAETADAPVAGTDRASAGGDSKTS